MTLKNSNPFLDNTRIHLFQNSLLKWFDDCGRKSLPWQKNKSAYRVWISEVMLQQTQVQTVIPYFDKFTSTFPNIKALANASIDDVLALWTGLGYYSRARNIHKAAQIIVNNYHGHLPLTPKELCLIPGIGKTTSHAICSLFDNQPTAILDGNVKRVLSRYLGIRGATNQSKTVKELWRGAELLMPSFRCADYTQAIMDLGATCCTRSQPNCPQCPMVSTCYANQHSLTHKLPEANKRKPLPTKQATFIIYQNQNREVLLEKRPDNGVWGGLWLLPQQQTAAKAFRDFRHTFSHFHLEMRFVKSSKPPLELKSNQRWLSKGQLSTVGLPKPIANLLSEFFA